MDILCRIRKLNRDMRLVNLSLGQVKELVRNFVRQSGWSISDEQESRDCFSLTAQNPKASLLTLFLKREPQIVNYSIFQEDKRCRIEILFDFFHNFHNLFYQLLVMWLGFVLLALYIGYSIYRWSLIHKVSPGMITNFYHAPLLLFFMVPFGFSLPIIWVTFDRKYFNFKKNFYNKIKDLTGINEIILTKGAGFPALFEVFFVQSIALLSFTIFFIKSMSFTYSVFEQMIIFVLVFLFFCCTLLGLILFRPTASIRLSLCQIGLVAGVIISVYSLTPFLSAGLSGYILQMKEAVLSIRHSATIQNALSTPRNIASANFISICIAYSSLVAVILVTLYGLLKIPPWMSETRHWYKTSHSKSDFQLSFKSSFSSKIFCLLIVIIWLICIVAVLPGIYFSISSLEFFVLGKNQVFGNRYTAAMTENIRVIFDYLSLSHGINLPITYIVRGILGLYSAPVCWILFVFILRRIRETFNIYKIIAVRQQIPINLRQKILEICSSSKIKPPSVIIKDSPLVSSNVMQVFLTGDVLMITSKTLEVLNEQELEALLAHEVRHLRTHSFMYNFLDFLSEWTLFGKGFLAVILNTKQLEFEADDFALDWLKRRGESKHTLINLLNKILIANSMYKYMAYSNSLLAFDDMEISEVNSKGKNFTFRESLKLLYELYFGDLIISYVHPTVEERIERIEAIA